MHRVIENLKNSIDKKNEKNRSIIYTATLVILISIYIIYNPATAVTINPPDYVTNLTNNSYADNYINWTWSEPPNIDPNLLILLIYIDDQWVDVIPGGFKYYNETNLRPGTQHKIGIQTVDIREYKTNGVLKNFTSSTSNSPIHTSTTTYIPTTPTYIPTITSIVSPTVTQILGTPTPINGTSFRFIAFADTKDGTDITESESKSIIKNNLNPRFIIFPGDLCPDTNCFSTTWKYAINGDSSGLTNNGLFNKTFATRGNHDAISISAWQSAFDFAGIASKIGAVNYVEQTKDLIYSFDYGNSHFVGLDVPGDVSTISSLQIKWLENDLKSAESRGLTHAFLFWHGPIYYVDGHSSTPPSDLINVLNNHSIVSAAFFGHEHVVTYTHIDNSRISTVTHPFEEFVSGGAGAGLYNTNVDRVDYCIGKSGTICPKFYGYMSVDVTGKDFKVSFYNMDGTQDKLLAFSK